MNGLFVAGLDLGLVEASGGITCLLQGAFEYLAFLPVELAIHGKVFASELADGIAWNAIGKVLGIVGGGVQERKSAQCMGTDRQLLHGCG